MLDMFFEKNTFHHRPRRSVDSSSCPQRLRGETATFEIRIGDQVIVEEGRRITARHVRQLEDAGVKKLHGAARIPRTARSWRTTSSTPTPAKCSPRPTKC